MQGRQDAAFPGDIAVLHGFAQRHALQFDTQPDHFGEIVRRHRRHAITALVGDADQAVILQPAQRLAQRAETDAETGAHAVEIELGARHQLAAHDRGAQPVDQRGGERRGARYIRRVGRSIGHPVHPRRFSGDRRETVQRCGIVDQHQPLRGRVRQPQRNQVDEVAVVGHRHRADRMRPVAAPDDTVGPVRDHSFDHRQHVEVRIGLGGEPVEAGELDPAAPGVEKTHERGERRRGDAIARIDPGEVIQHERAAHPQQFGRHVDQLCGVVEMQHQVPVEVERLGGEILQMLERCAAADNRRHPAAAHAAAVHVFQCPARQPGGDYRDAAQPLRRAVEGREGHPIVGAVRTAMDDNGAIDSQRGMQAVEILCRAVLGRIAARCAEWKLRLRSEHMHVAVAGTARHREGRLSRVAIGWRAGLHRSGGGIDHGQQIRSVDLTLAPGAVKNNR